MIKIGIVGDTHLGYRQYGLDERHEDFGKAWLWACETFVDEGCDFVIHTGDLFNSRQPDPVAMSQAQAGFHKLMHGGIASYIVAGNHEIFSRYPNWIDYLDDEGYVRLLGDMSMSPDVSEKSELRPVIKGFSFLGSTINSKLVAVFSGRLPVTDTDDPFVIAVAHAGVEGVLPHNDHACIHRNVIEQIRPNCDLLLLGHIHKPFEIGNWVFNPGSLETTNSKELEWEDRGVLILTIGEDRVVECNRIPSPRRKFIRDTATGVDLLNQYHIYLDSKDAIIQIDLIGDPENESKISSISELEKDIKETNNALMVRITDKRTRSQANITRPENVSKDEIEAQILEAVFGNRAKLASDIKYLVSTGAEADDIVDYVLGELNGPAKDNT